jgi:hypothetical protein
MRKTLFITLVALFLYNEKFCIAQTKSIPVDYVFLVDVSGSMAGAGGNVNIFPKVQGAIKEFIQTLEEGSRIFFIPFEGTIRETKEFQIRGSDDIKVMEDYVTNLVPDGARTAVYNSIESALQTVERYRQEHKAERAVYFYVYTDGEDNVSTGWTLASILRHFSLRRGNRDWLFYTELGLPKNKEKEKEFEKHEGTVYRNEPPEKVRSIIQVEVLLDILNFGNLKQTSKSTRIEKFRVHGKSELLGEYRIEIEPEFDDVKRQGVYVQITPSSFFPEENVQLEMSLTNPEVLRDREYKGLLKLISGDPLVVVVPDKIQASFLFEPERIVEIVPVSGTEFPVDFGELQPSRDEITEIRKSFALRFNLPAERSGEKLKLRLEQLHANPSVLMVGKDMRIDKAQGEEVLVGPETKEIHLVLNVSSSMISGEYEGAVIFESENTRIVGPSLAEVSNFPNAKQLSWRFRLTSPPWPWWVWLLMILLLAGVAFVVVRHKTRPPVLPDLRLEVKQPQLQEIDLTGKTSVSFGKTGEYLDDSEQSFVILPRKEERRVLAILRVSEGQILLRKAGEHESVTVIGEERIFDGDMIEFGDKKIMISSFSLSRDESQY